jgi:hypothetical protein
MVLAAHSRTEEQDMMYLAAITIGSQLVLAADVPKFDTQPSCRAAAAIAVMVGRTSENCMQDEGNARSQLEKSWADYSASDKAHCMSLSRSGGAPSYVELLSCVEMSRDAHRFARDRTQQGGQNAPAGSDTTGSSMSAAPSRPSAKP